MIIVQKYSFYILVTVSIFRFVSADTIFSVADIEDNDIENDTDSSSSNEIDVGHLGQSYESSEDEDETASFSYQNEMPDPMTNIHLLGTQDQKSENSPQDSATEITVTEKSPSQLIIDEMKSVLDSTLHHLSREKTQFSLNLLNQILSPLRSIHGNMTSLLKNTEFDYPAFSTLTNHYKEADGNLESQLRAVKELMDTNLVLLRTYSVAYTNTEQQLKIHSKTLESIYSIASNANSLHINGNKYNNNIRKARDTFQLSNCGGILTSDGGSIEYKSGETLNSEEGCFWIIAALNRNTTSIKFSLKSVGFIPTNDTYLSVGYFHESSFHSRDFIWTKFDPLLDKKLVNSSVAFIHFVSTSPLGDFSYLKKGFTLEFEALNTNSSSTFSSLFTPMFLKGASGAQKYPPVGQNYSNNERTAIVVQPTEPNSVLEMKWWGFENNIKYDSLNIWKMDETFTWRNIDTLFSNRSSSSAKEYPFSKKRNDPLLLIFRSDTSMVREGFEFEWKTSV